MFFQKGFAIVFHSKFSPETWRKNENSRPFQKLLKELLKHSAMTSRQGKRLNPFQHAYKRPDTYIGPAVCDVRKMWIFGAESNEENEENENEQNEEVLTTKKPSIYLKEIRYNPGMTRIFIEGMSNAIDNKWRSQKHKIKMTKIEFTIENDPESENFGWITIKNDGYCIPVEKASYNYEDYRTGKSTTEELYPAEVFFGEMLAGTNFEEDDTRKTSGKNGIGAKAIVVYSKQVVIEHTDPNVGKKFKQTYSNNGTERSKPKITSYSSGKGYTSISFLPDYEYFGYEGMDEDFFSLLKRFVYECSMITGLAVTLNGEKIQIKDLTKYVRLFYPDVKQNKISYFKAPNGDEAVLVEKMPDRDVEDDVSQISWINGINTSQGGVHVDVWKDSIFPAIVRAYNSRKPKKGEKDVLKTSAKDLYPYFTLFVRAEIEGAKFDSQTKERLNSPVPDLSAGNKKKFNDMIAKEIPKILKWNFVVDLEEKLSMKFERTLAKKEGTTTRKRVTMGDKANDANYAGTKESKFCNLFITEGLSAKAFAERLISSMDGGTNYNGVFAIRGKFINVQNASTREINSNTEVQDLKKILNLITGANYEDEENRSLLRYGIITFATDQDDDGFHIRGLLLNFFYKMTPSLFSLVAYDGLPVIRSLTTAVVMLEKGSQVSSLFYSNPEFRAWSKKNNLGKGISVKYLKGLGSHAARDVMVYLESLKQITYVIDENSAQFMDLGFNGKQSDWRKNWITQVKDEEDITVEGEMPLSNFVDEQLIIYHKMALRRALPSLFDGMKEAQRKALFGIMMDPDCKKRTVNLENLIGSVKKNTGYHHGAKSLEDTVKKMAQGYVGSNNIPLLVNDGEFGTRKCKGADAAASRYISTKPEDIVYFIFSKMDDPILERIVEDKEEVEYKFYMPVIPMILVNGAEGIASGFSTNVPCYNPLDIVLKIEHWLASGYTRESLEELPPLIPWYRGYTGEIQLLKKEEGRYEIAENTSEATSWKTLGILEPAEENGWWQITEVPVTVKIDTVKDYIESLLNGGTKGKKKIEKCLIDVRWSGTVNTPKWEIKPSKGFVPDIETNFKILQDVNQLTNMHVIDENDFPKKFSNPEDLLHEFCQKRLEYYGKRKDYWIGFYQGELFRETQRYNYVKAVAVDKTLDMYQNTEELEESMISIGLEKINSSFDYLLSMQMRSMTVNKLEELEKECQKIRKTVKDLEQKSPDDLWIEDLEQFKLAYTKFLDTRKEEIVMSAKKTKRRK